MLDKVLNEIVNEVALEGEEGCTFEHLFSLVESLFKKNVSEINLKIPLNFNDSYKAFIWNQIKTNNQLIFTKDNVVIEPTQFTFEELLSLNDSVRVKSTEEAQDHNIYGNLKTEKKKLTDKHRMIMNIVAKSRYQGISQYDLGEGLNMDSKTIFYYLKKLDQLGLIVKEEAYRAKMSTRIIFLKRFASQSEEIKDDQFDGDFLLRISNFKQNLCKLIEDSKEKMLYSYDALKLMGLSTNTQVKWGRARLTEMHNLGEIEKFLASDGKKQRICIRLPQKEKEPIQEIKESIRCEKTNKPTNNQDRSICRDLPIEYIFYQDLLAAKEKGLVRQDLINKYPFIDPIQSKLFSESATVPPKNEKLLHYSVYQTEERIGKSRQFRLFSLDGWRDFNRSIGKTFEEPKISTTATPVFVQFNATPAVTKRKTAKSPDPPTSKKTKLEPTQPLKRPLELNPAQPTKKTKKSLYNTTRERRSKILLDLIKANPIREVSQELLREFNAIEMAQPDGHKMARSSFDSMIQQLHDQKKLKIHVSTVKKPHGMAEIKRFLLDPSISHDRLLRFIEHYGVEQTMMTASKARPELKVVDVKTIPLLDPKPSPRPAIQFNVSWRYSATEFGWVSSKWLRAKELHEAIFRFSGGPRVEMPDFLQAMRLDTLIKLFGLLPYENPVFLEFVKKEKHRSLGMVELPIEIKDIIIESVPKIRLSIMQLLKVLKALGLVVAEQSKDERRIDRHLTLSDTGHVRDYKLTERPIRESVSLKSLNDVRYFWIELQNVCTEVFEGPPPAVQENDPLSKINLRAGWNTNAMLTPEQKQALDSFIDIKTKTIPDLDDPLLRAHIAKRSNVSQKRLVSYYRSISVAFNKFETIADKQRRKAEREAETSPAIRELIKASIENRKVKAELFKLKSAEPFSESTYVGSRKIRRLRVVVEPYRGQDKSRRSLTSYAPKNPFTPVQKDVLIYGYAIMKARSEESVFYWSPITKVLPDRTADRCRRVLSKMMITEPEVNLKIEKLKNQWIQIYKEGIKKKEIVDDNPWNTLDFDLSYFLEYFILKLKDYSEPVSDKPYLPRRVEDIAEKYHLTRHLNPSDKPNLTNSVSLWNKKTYDTLPKVSQFDLDTVRLQLVTTLIKMTLMTPDDDYKGKNAFDQFKKFPEEIVEKAVEGLKEEGTIISDKTRYGRIPGRHINVSERFLNTASGVFPYKLCENAATFYHRIADSNSIELDHSVLNSGSAAAVFDLLSQGRIRLDLKDREAYINSKSSLCYPKASAVSVRIAYIYKSLDLVLYKESQFKDKEKKSYALPIIQAEGNKSVYSTKLTVLNAINPPAGFVYKIIKEAGEKGVSWSEIYEKAKSDSEYKFNSERLCEILEQLLDANPTPLVQVAGFDYLRYVASEFMSSWMISGEKDPNYIHPLMWYDISGNIIQDAFDGCANTVLSHILKHPGISFASLRKNFVNFFSDYELYHILKYLLDSKKINSKKVRRDIVSKQSSIFSKRSITSVSHHGMNDNEITHYWAAYNYYL